jgi:hypothetical protein
MTERCPHCGANMKAFWHTLNPGLVSILIKAIQFVHENGKNEFHLQKDLHLSVNEFSNFTKLRFHALVAKVDEKPGFWLITRRGGQFLRGEIPVPLKVKTFRNRVIEHWPALVHIDDLKGKIPVFEREYAYEVQPVIALPPTPPAFDPPKAEPRSPDSLFA